MSKKTKIAGVLWIRPFNYERVRRVIAEEKRFPASYEVWLSDAQRRCQRLRDEGRKIVYVNLEADEFVRWCKDHRYCTDGHALDAYTKLMAYRLATGAAIC